MPFAHRSKILISLLFLVLSGCIQTEVLIKVRSDGSGTVEETLSMQSEMMGMMQGMASSTKNDSGEVPKQFGPTDENKLKAQAAEMGEGVSFVRAEEIKTDATIGYKAIFSFQDINKLKIDQNPSSSLPSQNDQKKNQEILQFKLEKDDVTRLSIRSPLGSQIEKDRGKANSGKAAEKDSLSSKVTKASAEDKQMMTMMKQFFKGMRTVIRIEVDGKVLKTNASYRDGESIVLMDIAFDKLLESSDSWEKFSQSKPETLEETKKILESIPGIRVDMNDPLVIEFK